MKEQKISIGDLIEVTYTTKVVGYLSDIQPGMLEISQHSDFDNGAAKVVREHQIITVFPLGRVQVDAVAEAVKEAESKILTFPHSPKEIS